MPSTGDRPALLVTIDTEPDDQWTRKPGLSVENTRRIPRLQQMFDRLGVRPTYFVSYGVARDPASVNILRAIRDDGRCEIGAHLHPWNTPPDYEIDGPVWASHPFLIEYPPEIQARKFEALHSALCEAFGEAPISFRAGRYGFDEQGLRLLIEHGYQVDSSITPLTRWSPEDMKRPVVLDFSRAPVGVYPLSTDDVTRTGESPVLEVPVSIGLTRRLPEPLSNWVIGLSPGGIPARALGKLFSIRKRWFRPIMQVPFREIEAAARWLLGSETGFLNMMFHSSELLPNSFWCRTEGEVDAFLERIEKMIRLATGLGCAPGTTLGEFGRRRAG
jgi:peptidoglycan/xylan/chitin deacetylase (PgdA/CDA1 family)